MYAINRKYVNFYIYKEENQTICFDTGTGCNGIKRELKKINIIPDQITHVFLTHSDKDHVDGIKLFNNAGIYMSKLELPLTEGKIKRSPFTKNIIKEKKYQTLDDGEIIKIGPIKIKAISTPGHTPGSMSYLLNDFILFVGDTIDIKKNEATTGLNFMNMNTELQKESIKKLSKLKDISIVCTGHSGTSLDFDSIMKKWQI